MANPYGPEGARGALKKLMLFRLRKQPPKSNTASLKGRIMGLDFFAKNPFDAIISVPVMTI